MHNHPCKIHVQTAMLFLPECGELPSMYPYTAFCLLTRNQYLMYIAYTLAPDDALFTFVGCTSTVWSTCTYVCSCSSILHLVSRYLTHRSHHFQCTLYSHVQTLPSSETKTFFSGQAMKGIAYSWTAVYCLYLYCVPFYAYKTEPRLVDTSIQNARGDLLYVKRKKSPHETDVRTQGQLLYGVRSMKSSTQSREVVHDPRCNFDYALQLIAFVGRSSLCRLRISPVQLLSTYMEQRMKIFETFIRRYPTVVCFTQSKISLIAVASTQVSSMSISLGRAHVPKPLFLLF